MKLPNRTFLRKLKEQHYRCFYCGDLLNKNIEIDHINPFSISRDGTNNNLCLCCYRCNREKSDKDLISYKQYISMNYPERLIRGMFYFQFINIYNG